MADQAPLATSNGVAIAEEYYNVEIAEEYCG
jgi:hypothetical protein